ncbi:MAG: calcium/sodium antiporter [Pseudomonadota bacterium]
MLTPIIALVVGFIALALSADRFTASAADIADNFGMSQLMIGLTIVAFGTSAPEIIVSINAALDHSGELALGNAIGSNIVNTGVVLGVTALVFPIVTSWASIRLEISVLLAVSIIAAVCLWDGQFSQFDGVLLFGSLLAGCGLIIHTKLKEQRAVAAHNLLDGHKADAVDTAKLPMQIVQFVIYLAILVASANVLVWGAKQIAAHYGISELIIGLTIVAIGTSLPELAASIASALKQQHDMALGNIIGSNLFNIGAVLSAAGMIEAFNVPKEALTRDYAVMMVLIALMFVIALGGYLIKRSDIIHISRLSGAAFVLCYILYSVVLFQQHV